jgi:6-phosphogluconolactonase
MGSAGMIEAEWWEYDDAGELAEAVASDVGFIIGQAIEARGDAVVALPGGKSPVPVFERLAEAKLAWRRVTIIPGDDRLVEVTDPLSNAAVLARHFMPLGARVVPLVSSAASDHRAAGAAADARLADLHWPLDLVWLGVGADGHTASILPGPDLDAALNAPHQRRAVGVMPDPLPPEAPVARVTLTRGAIAAARTLLLTLSGDAKRAVLEQAIEEGDASRLPVGRVLATADKPVDIHWCRA